MSEQIQPEVLHESQGLRIWRNVKNQFVIARLHHHADPNKRDPKWRKEAAAGMTPEQAARELDIDFTALLGAKVFPEITAKRNLIVTEPMDFGPDRSYWGGFDYGTRNPASFHIYTYDDGVFYSVWELYHPCKNIKEFTAEMRQFPYWESVRYIVADPDLWRLKAPSLNGLTTVEALFRQAGITKLIKGENQNELGWITMMREHWAAEDPTFKIFSTCPAQISEFETAIYVNQSQHQLDTQNYREEISDWHNHSLDDCKYVMLRKPQEQGNVHFEDPRMVDRWAQSSKLRSRQPHGPSKPRQSGPLKGYR